MKFIDILNDKKINKIASGTLTIDRSLNDKITIDDVVESSREMKDKIELGRNCYDTK